MAATERVMQTIIHTGCPFCRYGADAAAHHCNGHADIGIASCRYGPCSRVLPAPCYVRQGVAYCSEACALSDQTKASPFYRRMGGDWSR